jgi:hypothetical protein
MPDQEGRLRAEWEKCAKAWAAADKALTAPLHPRIFLFEEQKQRENAAIQSHADYKRAFAEWRAYRKAKHE